MGSESVYIVYSILFTVLQLVYCIIRYAKAKCKTSQCFKLPLLFWGGIGFTLAGWLLNRVERRRLHVCKYEIFTLAHKTKICMYTIDTVFEFNMTV